MFGDFNQKDFPSRLDPWTFSSRGRRVKHSVIRLIFVNTAFEFTLLPYNTELVGNIFNEHRWRIWYYSQEVGIVHELIEKTANNIAHHISSIIILMNQQSIFAALPSQILWRRVKYESNYNSKSLAVSSSPVIPPEAFADLFDRK